MATGMTSLDTFNKIHDTVAASSAGATTAGIPMPACTPPLGSDYSSTSNAASSSNSSEDHNLSTSNEDTNNTTNHNNDNESRGTPEACTSMPVGSINRSSKKKNNRHSDHDKRAVVQLMDEGNSDRSSNSINLVATPTTNPSRKLPPAPIDFCDDSGDDLLHRRVPPPASSKLKWIASPFYPSGRRTSLQAGRLWGSPNTGHEVFSGRGDYMADPAARVMTSDSADEDAAPPAYDLASAMQHSGGGAQYAARASFLGWNGQTSVHDVPSAAPWSRQAGSAMSSGDNNNANHHEDPCSPAHSVVSSPGLTCQQVYSCGSPRPSQQPPPLSVDEYAGEDLVPEYYEADEPCGIAVPEEICLVEHLQHLEAICQDIMAEASRQLHRRAHGMSDDAESWGDAVVALDLEGRDLGRNGSICIITLATTQVVYIIDMVKLSEKALEPGSALRTLLESPVICKLMFDCRADCDALFFLYQVRLCNVCDLQVSSCFALYPYSPLLPSMKEVFRSMELLTPEESFVKCRGKDFFDPRAGGSFTHWEARPLAPLLLEYCAVDVKHLFEASYLLQEYAEEAYSVGEARVAAVCEGHYLRRDAHRDF